MDRMGTALLWVSGIFLAVLLGFIVWGNDKGGTTEIGLLQGSLARTHATDAQCDALYHAIWKVKQEPSHSTLINLAVSLDCPFENE